METTEPESLRTPDRSPTLTCGPSRRRARHSLPGSLSRRAEHRSAHTRRPPARSLARPGASSGIPDGHRRRLAPAPGRRPRGPGAVPRTTLRRSLLPGPPVAARAGGEGPAPGTRGVVPGGGPLRRRRRRTAAEGAHGASLQRPHHRFHQRYRIRAGKEVPKGW
ncbi:hypothetical protein ACQJBY_037761 [Aegilops geniculata]